MSAKRAANPQSIGSLAKRSPFSSRNHSKKSTFVNFALPLLRNKKSGSPYSKISRLCEISYRPFMCTSSVETPLTDVTTPCPSTKLTRIFVFGLSLIVVG